MGAPVGEFAAGVLVPVAEGVVAIAVERDSATIAFAQLRQGPVGNGGSGAEPGVPIEPGRHCRLRDRRRGFHAVDAAGHLRHLADPSVADQCHCEEKTAVRLRALHRAHLEHPSGLLDNPLDELPLVDGQRQRLLAVDVLAGPHRLDGDLGVPVIGGRDHDRVDILPVEDLPVVGVAFGGAPLPLRDVGDVRGKHSGIDVGERGEVGELERLLGDRPSLVPQADRREHRSVALRLLPGGLPDHRQRCGGGGVGEKATA